VLFSGAMLFWRLRAFRFLGVERKAYALATV